MAAVALPQPSTISNRVRLRHPVDLRLTLGPLRRGGGDPALRLLDGEVWRATRTPLGPATLRLVAEDDTIRAQAWGPGAEWVIDGVPALCGQLDDAESFAPADRLVAGLRRRLWGLRLPRAAPVLDTLVGYVCSQRVTAEEAHRGHAALVRRLGDPAPGPGGLVLPPSSAVLAATPSWTYHRLGIERRRADTIRRAALVARRLEEAVTMPGDQARARLRAVRGVGEWTAASVALSALGDADAVPVGDWNLPHIVTYNLTGAPRGDDARMLELLEPYAGHRGRVLRLLVAGGRGAPRFAPRQPIRDFRRT